jgi:hypothetical protein
MTKDFGMSLKRKSIWGKNQEEAVKLFKLRNSGTTMEDICEAFPDKSKKDIIKKLHKMGFSAKDKQ